MKNLFYLSMLMIAVSITITAQPLYDSIRVYNGWNLIGSTSTGPIDSLISTRPPGIIASPFYKFTAGGGYTATDTLIKVGGYWVKIVYGGPIPAWLYIWRIDPSWLWTTCGNVPYEGKTYNTILIGDQCWLRQNLDVGTMIPGIENQINNPGGNVIEKYCYDDNTANCEIYGGLYQWNEAMQYVSTSGSQGICPNGWHIPTQVEFETLKATVGNDGNKLKAVGQGSGGGAGTNVSGFSGLLAGYRHYAFLNFDGLGNEAEFWTSNDVSIGLTAAYVKLFALNNTIQVGANDMDQGFSIRCIKNN